MHGQKIHGTITDAKKRPLPFATIYVRNLETGVSTNEEGNFEYSLPRGKYDLVFQYLGYTSQLVYVEVDDKDVRLDIQLSARDIVLREVEIKAGKEDPAYGIMRKAIAKTKYHLNQLDSYSSSVYTKGSGRLIDAPFFLRKTMEKEGIDSTSSFTSESISKVTYTRPNNYETKVISIRSNGEDNSTDPQEVINSSFYEPMVMKAVSPLSPKAFAYYRFEYLGTFNEGSEEISKIKVIPRSKGDDLFRGQLYIVENSWAIHSLSLITSHMGVQLSIGQIYNPIKQQAWLPVSHTFEVQGKFFGFDFEYKYLATISDYDLTLNPSLVPDVVLLDTSIVASKTSALPQSKEELEVAELFEGLDTGNELTKKDMRKMLRTINKMEMKTDTATDIRFVSSVTIDSSANILDAMFWKNARPVPLTDYEVRGYEKADSLAIVEKSEAEGDTIKTKSKKKGFHIQDLLLGNTYKVGERAHLELKSPLETIGFNTVEGYHFNYRMEFTKTMNSGHWVSVLPTIRYGFASERWRGTLRSTHVFGKINSKNTLTIEGGRFIEQVNDEPAIHPILNSLTTLLLESNYLKIYEKDFFKLQFSRQWTEKSSLQFNAEYAVRSNLVNHSNHRWIDYDNRIYTSNQPVINELSSAPSALHRAWLTSVKWTLKPWLKYKLENGKKKVIRNSSPALTVKYNNGLPILDTNISFHHLSLGVAHVFDVGVRGTLSYRANAGAFLSAHELDFVDFAHFQGNQTPFQYQDATASFRLLPYYQYSTKGAHAQVLMQYDFRKFVLSRLNFLSKRGIRESILLNHLETKSADHYTELGYGINNIFRIFKLEGIASFQDGQYLDWGVRVGVSAGLEEMFDF